MRFILLGITLEIISLIYIILVFWFVYKDEVSVGFINKSIIGYWSIMVIGIISMAIGIIIKLI